jgi:uncharacterized protein (TIGR03437 family)
VSGGLAPGEIVSIFGFGLGPEAGVSARLNADGKIATSLAGTQVLFNGIPAPLLYVQAGQVNAVAPFEIDGAKDYQVMIQIEFNGRSAPVLYERAARWNPGIFTISGQPGTQGAVLNRDGTVNSNANPGRLGSVVSLFATGMGALSPSGVDGQISPIPPPWITLACQPLVMVAGVSAAIRYAGAAPGFGCGSYSNQRPTSSFSPARDFTECGSGKHQRM